jgi:hypothetical protein
VLPVSPGKITVETTKLVSKPESSSGQSRGFIQDSAQDDKEETHCESMIDGWVLDTNSVSYHFTKEEGKKDRDWFDLGNKSSTAAACWRFKTLHKSIGTSGKLHFYLKYRMARTVQVPQVDRQELTLKWSEQRVVTVDPGATWKIVFERFDGKIIEFGTAASDPYLRVRAAGNVLTISTPPP